MAKTTTKKRASARSRDAVCSEFRAGDTVKHGPTGETWILATDQDGKRVMPCGWPESMADAEDCDLVESATDQERMEMLTNWAAEGKGREHEMDWRTRLARRQINLPNAEVSDGGGH